MVCKIDVQKLHLKKSNSGNKGKMMLIRKMQKHTKQITYFIHSLVTLTKNHFNSSKKVFSGGKKKCNIQKGRIYIQKYLEKDT